MKNNVIESEIDFDLSDRNWLTLPPNQTLWNFLPQFSFTFYAFLKLRVIGLSLISDTNILSSFCSLSSPELCSK